MKYLQINGGTVRGGISNFRLATRKISFPAGDYNMRAVIPVDACRQLQIEAGNPWEFALSHNKEKLLCELALYRTEKTTNTVKLGSGATLIHIPSQYKPYIVKGTQILWRWNTQEVYGEIPLHEYRMEQTTNPFAIKRERIEERKYRMYYKKPRKVPIWKGK